MDLIDRGAAFEAIDHEREILLNQGRDGAEHVVVHHARRLIEDMPSIPAVPLDKLCEWLAGIYGSPCQFGEIECYPQCEPDGEGMCLGMRSNDVTCWKSYLTKWMEGQHDT